MSPEMTGLGEAGVVQRSTETERLVSDLDLIHIESLLVLTRTRQRISLTGGDVGRAFDREWLGV